LELGSTGPAHLVPLALAEWICWAPDRVSLARVHWPFDRVQRSAPSANSCEICDLL